MKKIFYPDSERGGGEYGWLRTLYSFSFNTWYNKNKMGFGTLRVLNDDVIAGGEGFGRHGHKDMEIITIVMKGAVAHQDSIGNSYVVHEGDVQVMSAGSGVMHSEENYSKTEPLELFQIWIEPKEFSIKPRYNQKNYDFKSITNNVIELVGKNSLVINQDAFIFYGALIHGKTYTHQFHTKNQGAYIFVIEGALEVDDQSLEKRDALGIWSSESFSIMSKRDTSFLIIEIPMEKAKE